MENRSGLVIASEVSQAGGIAERYSGFLMACSLLCVYQKTPVADKL